MNGVSATTSVNPVYGTQGVGSASNTPGGLMYSVSWTDSNGNLWLFGGYSATLGYNNDLWRFNTTTNQWIWVKGPGLAHQYGWYGTMGLSSASNIPGARYLASGWADNSGNLWLYGGAGRAASTSGYLNDLWKYNTFTNQWTWMKGSSIANQAGIYGVMGTPSSTNQPGGRYGQITLSDNSGNLWLFGGYGYAATTSTVGNMDDLWRYNITSNTWTWMKGSDTLDQMGVYGTKGVPSTSNTPGGRRYGTGWKDNSGNLWMFGGYGYASSTLGLMNDLWKYNVGTGEWTWTSGANAPAVFGWYGTMGLPASNNYPGSRYLGGQGLTDIAGNLWQFGGYSYSSSSGGRLNDLWRYNIGNDQWTWMRGSAAPNQPGVYGTQTVGSFTNTPGARYGQVTWRDNNGSIWVYGGLGYPSAALTTTVIGYLNDMWRFDICIYPTEPIDLSPPASLTLCSGNSTTLSALSGTNTIKWYSSFTSTLVLATGTTFATPVLSAIGSPVTYNYYVESESCAPSVSRTVISVTVNPSPTITVNSNSICAGGVFVMLPSGANTYTFSGGSQVVFPTISTSYSVSGTSVQGCISTVQAIANVTVHASPIISANSASICSGNSFVINPTGAYSYTYSGGSPTVAPSTTTFYLVTGTSSMGCVSQAPAVSNVLVFSSPTITVNSGSICSGASFTLSPSGSSSYTYSGGMAIVTPTSNSTYTVTGSSSNGCESSAVSTVMVNSNPTISANSGIICSGNSFTIVPSGAATYTYSGGSSVVSPSTTTAYMVTGSSSAGCVSASAALSIVMVNSAPVISVNSGTMCEGSTFTLIPGGASSYTFSGGSAVVSPSVSSVFSVSGTSSLGCLSSSPALASITVIQAPVVTVNSGTICQGGSFTLSPSGASSFSISGGSAVVTPSSSTTYTVYGSNTQGCVSTVPALSNVVVNTTLSIAVNSGSICEGETFTIVPSGAITYTISGGTPFVNPNSTTSYSVIGTVTGGCISLPAVSTVTVYSTPAISVNSGAICSGSSFTLLPSGAQTYTFSGGSAVVSPSVNSSYSVTGTSSAGCTSSSPAVSFITVNSLPLIAVNSGSVCTGGSFTLVPSGASTYTFSGGSALVSPSVTSSYSVTGTSSLGCVSSVAAVSTVTVNTYPIINVNSGAICSGDSFTINPTGATGYTFSGGTAVVSPVSNTAYTVTGISSAGCSSFAVSTVTVNARPVISLSSGTICSGESFTLLPSGAQTYTFSGGSAVVSPSVNSSYSVTGTSSAGCTSTSVAVSFITVNNLPLIAVNSGSVCTGGSFTLVPSGASTYTFSGGSALVSPSVTSSYSVTGTSSVGCVSSVAAVSTVTVNTYPIINVNSGAICSGDSFTINPTGATGYTFSGGTAVVSPVSNTAYTVTGINSAGCSSFAVSTVTVNTRPVISLSSGTICSGESFTLLPSGAQTYTFSGGSAVVSPSVNSSYSVTGTSSAGCTSTSVAVSFITVNNLPLIAVNSGSVCTGGSLTLVPSGASTYTFSGGSAVVSPSVTSTYSVTGTSSVGCVSSVAAVSTVTVNTYPIINVNSGAICSGDSFTMNPTGATSYTFSGGTSVVSPVSNTAYTVTGINSAGCSSFAVSTVTVNTRPIISLNSGTICSGESFTLVPSGAQTYTFSGGSAVVSPSVNSSYSVTGTSSAGCTSTSVAVSFITVNNLPLIAVNSGSVCTGGSFTLVPSGASTYTFSGGSAVVSPSVTSTYSVTGTSSLGCVSSVAAISTVTVNTYPIINVNSGAICSGDSFTMNPTGATGYTFSGGTAVVSPVSNTAYTVTGINSVGCSSFAVSTVTVNARPVISLSSGTICSGESFTLLPSGAQTYTFSGGSAVVSPSVNSSYSVTGTSSAGCTSTSVAVSFITVNNLPLIAVNSGSVCTGGSFTLVPSGASSYTFSGGSAVVSPSVTSTYSVTGTSSLGCVSSVAATAAVIVFNLPVVSVNSGSLCSGNSFTLFPLGASNYTFSSGSPVVSPTLPATYTVLGTDANGCVSAAVSSVNVIASPVITVNSGTICAGTSFTITPSGAFLYTVSGGASIVTPGSTTSYSVYGSNLQGCTSATAAISTVSVNPIPIVAVSSGTVCSGNAFTLTPSGALTYTYSSGSAVVSPVSNTSYSIVGSTAGCLSAPAIAQVTVYALPMVTVNSGTLCSGGSFTLIPSGASSYSFIGGGPVVNPAITTNYTVVGTDLNGCTSLPAVASLVVSASPTVSVNSGSICSGDSFSISAFGASSYSISGGSAIVSPTVSATYTVVGSSSAGCISAPALSSVSVHTLPTVSVNSGTMCSGRSFTLMATGAATYSYSGGASVVSPTANSNYSVTGTSSAGCIAPSPAIASVVVFPDPVISAGSGSICAGNTFTIIPSGASTYTFSTGSAVVSPSATATYSISGTSSMGCVSSVPGTLVVNVISLPVISVNAGAICNGVSFTLTPSGASTYSISGGSAIVSPSTTTSYSVSGTNLQGCTSTLAAVSTITVNNLPLVTISGGTICAGDAFTLSPIGASSYTFSSGSPIVSPLSTMVYSVIGTSSAGCVSAFAATSTVLVNALPNINVNSGFICAGDVFTLNPTGAATYTFSSGSATVQPITNSTYSVTGTGTTGCNSATPAIANVSVIALPVVTVNSGSICVGQSFTLNPTGAISYTYSGGSSIVNPTISTTYTVSGTNAQGCKSNPGGFATVSVIPVPLVTVNSGSVCAGSVFSLMPSGALSYTFSSGANTVIPVGISSYSVWGTNQAGCVSVFAAISSVTASSLPVISVNSGSVCAGQVFTMNPVGALTYTYSNGSPTVAPITSSSYTITGKDGNGCLSANSAVSQVLVRSNPVISASGGSVCEGSVFTLNPTGAFSFTFSGGSNTVSPLVTSSYSIFGANQYGCVSQVAVTVTVVAVPILSLSSNILVLCKGSSTILSVSGANQYNWSTGAVTSTISVSPSVNQVFYVTGFYQNGCSAATAATVNVSECAGITNMEQQDGNVTAFPNPTTGEFVIITVERCEITILNNIGQVVLKQGLEEGKHQMNLDNQAKGLYFIFVEQSSGNKVIKIVKH